jgi:hypothetical protein
MLQSATVLAADLAACMGEWTPATLTFSDSQELACLVDVGRDEKTQQSGGVTFAGSSRTILVNSSELHYDLLIPEKKVTLSGQTWTIASIELEPGALLATVQLRPLV